MNGIAIIGLGFTGCSLGLALKKNVQAPIMGIDEGSVLIRAKNISAIDNGCLFSELEQGLKGIDIVFCAAPIRITNELLPLIARAVPEKAVVTDIGAAKLETMKIARACFSGRGVFIGGHPIIGYKRGGIEHADPYLFVNNTYVLTPFPETPREAMQRLEEVIRAIGARLLVMDPREHDELSGGLNHILQLIAIAHVNAMLSELSSEKVEVAVALASERFKNFTEAILTPLFFWEEIIGSNRAFIEQNLRKFIARLESLIAALGSESFTGEYEKAKSYVAALPSSTKGFKASLSHIYVTIEDKPGAIARVASIVASGGYDIRDIGIVRIREGEAATLRVSFANQGIASRVHSLLAKNAYSCRTQFDYEEFSA